ncbi:MAG: hypothetical protein R6U15_00975 [Candidatus Izemoplasmatales bacterium]
MKYKIKNILIIFAKIAGVILILKLFGGYGFIVFCAVLALYKIIIQRKLVMDSIRNIETRIWGYPLEKKYWKNRGKKIPKVKIKWKKKKQKK